MPSLPSSNSIDAWRVPLSIVILLYLNLLDPCLGRRLRVAYLRVHERRLSPLVAPPASTSTPDWRCWPACLNAPALMSSFSPPPLAPPAPRSPSIILDLASWELKNGNTSICCQTPAALVHRERKRVRARERRESFWPPVASYVFLVPDCIVDITLFISSILHVHSIYPVDNLFCHSPGMITSPLGLFSRL